MITEEEHVEAIAKVAHEVIRAYRNAIGDNSPIPWDSTVEAQKSDARIGTRYLLRHPDATAEDAHNNWRRRKEVYGWKWGKVKDDKLLTHPSMKSYNQLPPDSQVTDYLFIQVVRVLTSA